MLGRSDRTSKANTHILNCSADVDASGRDRRAPDYVAYRRTAPPAVGVDAAVLFAAKTDVALGFRRRCHKLADSVKHDFELGVVLSFERGKLAGKVGVGLKHLS